MKLRTWTDHELINTVAQSNSYSTVLDKLGIRIGGGAYKSIKKHIERLGLDTSHFRGYILPTNIKKLTRELVLVQDSKIISTSLRRFVIKESVIKYECAHCNNQGYHNGKPLSLQLDHINGISNDNRVENLRFLCPNCHAQTETYSRVKKPRIDTKPEPNTVCHYCKGHFWSVLSNTRMKRRKGYNVYCGKKCAIDARSLKCKPKVKSE